MKPITILRRRAKQGDQGYPRATIAFYGPNDREATKVVLGIFQRDGDEGTIYRWFTDAKDARYDTTIQRNILARVQEHEVASLIMSENLLGCPHEEGTDYPEGETCPHCPYWKDKDRFKSYFAEDTR